MGAIPLKHGNCFYSGANRTEMQKAADKKMQAARIGIPRPGAGEKSARLTKGRAKPGHGEKVRNGHFRRDGRVTNLDWRDTPEYKVFKDKVRNRDTDENGVLHCQNCGISEQQYKESQRSPNLKLDSLHVHHTLPAEDFEAYRFDVEKALTVCNPCHQKLEHVLKEDKKYKRGIYTPKLRIRLTT